MIKRFDDNNKYNLLLTYTSLISLRKMMKTIDNDIKRNERVY